MSSKWFPPIPENSDEDVPTTKEDLWDQMLRKQEKASHSHKGGKSRRRRSGRRDANKKSRKVSKVRKVRKSRRMHRRNNDRRSRSKSGGESQEKIDIKRILGITHTTQDDYNPKANLKEYYEKLLEIYKNNWSNLEGQDKDKLAVMFTTDRSLLSTHRHPKRTNVYIELINDLRLLDVMHKQIGRDIVIDDFYGGELKIDYSHKKIFTCKNFGFISIPNNNFPTLQTMFLYNAFMKIPNKFLTEDEIEDVKNEVEERLAAVNRLIALNEDREAALSSPALNENRVELERSPDMPLTIIENGGKSSRRHRRRHHTLRKKGKKSRRMRARG